jgi:hypothetical protein
LLSYFPGLKTTTKKIAASLFTLLGLAPLLFIIFAGIKQQEIRHNMKRQLEIKMLHTITLARKDVHWYKEGKELLINGRMFDVRSFQPASDGKIIFSGLYDDDETSLVNKVRENQQTDKNTGGKLLAQLFQLLQASFNNAPSEVFIPSLNNNHFPGIEQRLASPFITILSPPPQV